MFWRAAAFDLGLATLVMASPHLFDRVTYAPIRPWLAVLAALAVAGGVPAVGVITGFLPRRLHAFAAAAAIAPAILLAVNFVLTGALSGVIAYGIESAAFAWTAWLAMSRRGTRLRVYMLMVGATLVTLAVSMILAPASYANAATYAQLGDFLWFVAPMFLVGGTGLIVLEVGSARPHAPARERLSLAFASIAAIDLALLVNVFATTGAWTGVLSYSLMAVLLLIGAPRTRADVLSPILFACMAAVAAFGDLLTASFGQAGFPMPAPGWSIMRPSIALALCYVGVAFALALHPRRPFQRLTVTLAVIGLVNGVAASAAALRQGSLLRANQLLGLVRDDDMTAGTFAVPAAVAIAAVIVIFVLWRPRSRLVPLLFTVAGATLAGVVALNLLAFMLRSSYLFDVYGLLSMRAHATVALGALGLALVGAGVPRLMAAPIADRLFGMMAALAALILLRGYVSDAALAHVFVDVDDFGDPRFLDAVSDARALTLALLIAISSGTALLLTRTVTMPLERVVDAIARARAGEAGARAEVAGDDEIGIVARSFNELTSELAAQSDFNEAVRRAQSDLGDALVIVDDGEPREWNEALPRITGYTDDELHAMRVLDLVPPDARRELERTSGAHRGGTYRFESSITRRDGTSADVEVAVSPLRDMARPTQLAIVRDITARKNATRALEHAALYDHLTGLPNRANFVERVDRLVGDAHGPAFSVLYLDVDRFKQINDAFGHDLGDEVLRELAVRLARALDAGDTLARFAADEFAVLLPYAKDVTRAIATAEMLRAVLLQPLDLRGHQVFVEATFGIVCHPGDGQDAETLIRHADSAMYEAKHSGKAVAAYAVEQDPQNQRRLEIMGDLRHAIERDELVMYFQPQIRLADGRGCGSLEALVRWQHPVRGMVPPGDFISIAEDSGFINELTTWVIRDATAAAARLGKYALAPRLAINVSARDLHYPGLVPTVDLALRAARLDPSTLTIEITETAVMTDTQRSLDTLARLSALGVRLSIDDFGAGYSSLAYLRRLPVNELKIDRMFVADMLANASSDAIVSSVIQLGHSLGLTVVAEGVEDAQTLAALRARRCDLAQGYHIARPMPFSDLDDWLRTRRPNVEVSSAAD